MSLLALQHGFRDWLTAEVGAVRTSCGDRSGAGLRIYLNNYREQLMACLCDSYEAVHAWLGDTDFERAAAVHIDDVPPTSWTLDAYALNFPETLVRLHPHDLEIGELARLERALGQAFVAADHVGLGPAELKDIDWDYAVLIFAPSLMMLPAHTNAAAIWSAIAQGATPPAAELLPDPATTLIWRDGLTPAFRTLEAGEGRALEMLRQGRSFGALCQSLVGELGKRDGPAAAGAYLARWIADGLVTGHR